MVIYLTSFTNPWMKNHLKIHIWFDRNCGFLMLTVTHGTPSLPHIKYSETKYYFAQFSQKLLYASYFSCIFYILRKKNRQKITNYDFQILLFIVQHSIFYGSPTKNFNIFFNGDFINFFFHHPLALKSDSLHIGT